MFDDIKNQSSRGLDSGREDEQKNKKAGEDKLSAPAGPKPQVEDIFADTDGVSASRSGLAAKQADHPIKPSVFQPKESASPEEKTTGAEVEQNSAKLSSSAASGQASNIKRYAVLSMAVLAVVAVLGGGWYAYSKFFAADGDLIPTDNSSEEPALESNQKQEKSIENIKEQIPAVKPIVKPADKDRDGLSDEEEAKLGTNANNVDSDSDGLFDREEVKVYKTDPLNPDTDGDGFLDGNEVRDGYNPNGAGKLYEILNNSPL